MLCFLLLFLFVWSFIVGRMIMTWMQVLQNIWCQVNWCQSGCILLAEMQKPFQKFISSAGHVSNLRAFSRNSSIFFLYESCQSLTGISSSISNLSWILVVIGSGGIFKVRWPWMKGEFPGVDTIPITRHRAWDEQNLFLNKTMINTLSSDMTCRRKKVQRNEKCNFVDPWQRHGCASSQSLSLSFRTRGNKREDILMVDSWRSTKFWPPTVS